MILLKSILFFQALCLGSFVNVLIGRLPARESLMTRSRCNHCLTKVFWFDNIPLLSYLLLRGKCRKCGGVISWRYPFVELLCGLASIVLMGDIDISSIWSWYNYYSYLLIACIFVAHFFIDLDHFLLLDELNLALLLLILPLAISRSSWVFWGTGALIGVLFPLMVSWLFYVMRGQVGLGGGDIKLWGVLGFYLGPVGIMQNVFLSCALGSIFAVIFLLSRRLGKNTPIAFGPFILIVVSIQIFIPNMLRNIFSIY